MGAQVAPPRSLSLSNTHTHGWRNTNIQYTVSNWAILDRSQSHRFLHDHIAETFATFQAGVTHISLCWWFSQSLVINYLSLNARVCTSRPEQVCYQRLGTKTTDQGQRATGEYDLYTHVCLPEVSYKCPLITCEATLLRQMMSNTLSVTALDVSLPPQSLSV